MRNYRAKGDGFDWQRGLVCGLVLALAAWGICVGGAALVGLVLLVW